MIVKFTDSEKQRLEMYCKRHKLKINGFIARGHSARIFLVQKGRKKFVAKLERDDSPRENMLEKEAFYLKLANSIKVGPKLVAYDFHFRVLIMEFIEGKTLNQWLKGKRTKKELKKFFDELLKQAERLDELGLDHGQLAGRGVNILVKKGKHPKPIIIDFEKASVERKVHNRSVLEAFIGRNKALKKLKIETKLKKRE